MSEGEALAGPCPTEDSANAASPEIIALYTDFSVELRRMVLGVVRNPELADDVMQTTFIKVVERGHEARFETARGWLFRVAFHEALAVKRRRASRDRGERRAAVIQHCPSSNLDDGLVRAEAVEAVREALGRLSEDQLRVVRARVFEEKTFAEIAGETGLPLGTVLSRMRRALEQLRRSLRPGD
ncbi:RNA polymerase sigma factor [Tundrisphaera lichenicola]|uniref:RNA polymerase sigma factor n=1 Tax=Tundrisphaera lichenicola TaxID=2029860 RepID=UPI003EBD614B